MRVFGIRLRRGELKDLVACFLTPRQHLQILSRLRNSFPSRMVLFILKIL